MSSMESDSRMPDTYDRLLGALDGLPGMMISTKPATIETVTPLLGTSHTYIVRTFRQQHGESDIDKSAPAQFTVFLKFIEGTQAIIKLVIPPKVADLIARQRDALTTQAKTATSDTCGRDTKGARHQAGIPEAEQVAHSRDNVAARSGEREGRFLKGIINDEAIHRCSARLSRSDHRDVAAVCAGEALMDAVIAALWFVAGLIMGNAMKGR